nr:iron ABC transporter permease [uncultured Methanospirillum sp.]
MQKKRSFAEIQILNFNINNIYKIKCIFLILILIFLLGLTIYVIILGAYHISVSEVWTIIAHHITGNNPETVIEPLHDAIVWKIRIPRILLALMVGGALSVSGAVFQGCLRNPLVDPYILGVSSGAAFGAALGIVFPTEFFSIQILAFAFGSLAVVLAYVLATSKSETPIVSLILSGVIIGSIFAALVSLMKYLADATALREIVFWLMGGFYYAGWSDVELLWPCALVMVIIAWVLSWKINVLSMGDEEARALGVHPEKYKLVLISVATFLTAISVSLVGIIAWVGLMVPHATRIIFGPDNRFVIPASFMVGGIYMIICDTVARCLTSSEIPVGIITSLLGAPYLCYLLRNKGKYIFG